MSMNVKRGDKSVAVFRSLQRQTKPHSAKELWPLLPQEMGIALGTVSSVLSMPSGTPLVDRVGAPGSLVRYSASRDVVVTDDEILDALQDYRSSNHKRSTRLDRVESAMLELIDGLEQSQVRLLDRVERLEAELTQARANGLTPPAPTPLSPLGRLITRSR